MDSSTPVALSIAGSDSGGGAGVQADLRTFARLGVFGTTAITAVTAQNLDGITHIVGIDTEIVLAQTRAVLAGFHVDAMKTGMLWTADVVRGIAELLDEQGAPRLVIDPVMVSTSGSALIDECARSVYCEEIIPRCFLLTPNLDEAQLFLEVSSIDVGCIEDAAIELARRYGCHVLLKGGHLAGDPVDVLCLSGERVIPFRSHRVHGVDTHGTGCILSAAVTALLAHGRDLEEACRGGIAFVHEALRDPHQLRGGPRVAGIEGVGDGLERKRHRP